ncbi:hypothetical protein T484DRAFT_1771984 [Baffinella frigidus]|nr:hypothetical protein T484DRAFT_1771984 [Cryptophyta sp. CCMP2293]
MQVLDLERLGAKYAEVHCVQGFVLLLSWLKLLEYSKYMSAGMQLLVHSIASCAWECGVWFFMLVVIVNAYGQAFYLAFGPDIAGFNAFYLAFGPDIAGFNDIYESLSTICIWLFAVVDFQKVLSSDQLIASLLFVSFQAVYSVIMVNMFIVILIRSYHNLKKAR